MFQYQSFRTFALTAAVAFTVVGTGCVATRKHVREQMGQKITPLEQRVTPLEDRMGKSEAKLAEQGKDLDAVETDLSKTKEKVTDVENTGKKTIEQVQVAANAASAADKKAGDARTYAETRSNTIEKFIESRDQFKLAKSDNVLFGFNKTELDDEAKAKLDEMVKDTANRKRFIIEVQGFADNIGPAAANVEVSQRRAEAVVRYLTNAHKVPLRNIHLIGSGSESPVAENKSRDGRRQNRRVEIRVFAPEVENSSSLTSAQLR